MKVQPIALSILATLAKSAKSTFSYVGLGQCKDSNNKSYKHFIYFGQTANIDAVSEWCNSATEYTDGLVGIGIWGDRYYYCFYDYPMSEDMNAVDFDPPAGFTGTGQSGSGAISHSDQGDPGLSCYRNDDYVPPSPWPSVSPSITSRPSTSTLPTMAPKITWAPSYQPSQIPTAPPTLLPTGNSTFSYVGPGICKDSNGQGYEYFKLRGTTLPADIHDAVEWCQSATEFTSGLVGINLYNSDYFCFYDNGISEGMSLDDFDPKASMGMDYYTGSGAVSDDVSYAGGGVFCYRNDEYMPPTSSPSVSPSITPRPSTSISPTMTPTITWAPSTQPSQSPTVTCYAPVQRIVLSSEDSPIQMLEFQVWSNGVNIAPEATVYQSSTRNGNDHRFGAANAIDANNDTFSHTESGENFLLLYWTEPKQIDMITIVNRGCGEGDENGCFCRLSNATLHLEGALSEEVAQRVLPDTCGMPVVTESFQSNSACDTQTALSCFRNVKRVRIGRAGVASELMMTLPINLFEVHVMSEMGENVALDGRASQSSTMRSFEAANAIDGDNTTFSHTGQADLMPEWALDLHRNVHVEEVSIVNRYCRDASDPNGCLCRLSHSQLFLEDEYGGILETPVANT